ncbi:MAG: hypothetical protein ACR2KS_12490 [Candidatus Eremiobacter antarcticus]|nr:hypothetical protein [Candidatus Eremiobacteraeota bacterium]MBC5808561.1 hypothetical protein [Candidatus Eremiobacteraeota bacterium]
MKRSALWWALLSQLIFWPEAAWAMQRAQPSQPASPASSRDTIQKAAPADEYFGRMKLSILGINNTIRDAKVLIANDKPHARKYYSKVMWAEQSLQDWASKYPQDDWIPRQLYDMSHLFRQMRTPEADREAINCRWMLFSRFASTRLSAVAKKEWKPLFAKAERSANANAPAPVQRVDGLAKPARRIAQTAAPQAHIGTQP